ncbi:helix-turn-helix transcriptional regulator [Limnobaculum xujianqingii]|uniref:helix-turn-helix transcriptional regulator n=1 Tax=Limnobaculum xujianqingii TaxID=2738837 RepID=UPI001129EE51|nr:AlpA family phage regulatory protein [Limnobaculum xujianqingii]
MKFLKLKDVIEMTGMAKSTIYARIQAGTFPKQYKSGTKSSVWLLSEIITWMENIINK